MRIKGGGVCNTYCNMWASRKPHLPGTREYLSDWRLVCLGLLFLDLGGICILHHL